MLSKKVLIQSQEKFEFLVILYNKTQLINWNFICHLKSNVNNFLTYVKSFFN